MKSKYTNGCCHGDSYLSTLFPWERARSVNKFTCAYPTLDLCHQKSKQDQEVSLRLMI